MANLKFYSQALDNAVVEPKSGSAAGHAIELLKDRLLATYWQGAVSTDQSIDIDFGVATDVDHCLLLHNMVLTTDISLWSAAASDYSDEVQRSPSYASIDANIMLMPTVDEIVHKYRYWRIKLSNCVSAPKIYLIFMGTKQEITIRYNKGYKDRKIYAGDELVETYGGMRYSRRYQTRGRQRLEYAWEMLSSANQLKLQTLIANSMGAALPFYLCREDGTYLYCRLRNSEVSNPEVEHQLYNIDTLIFEEEF